MTDLKLAGEDHPMWSNLKPCPFCRSDEIAPHPFTPKAGICTQCGATANDWNERDTPWIPVLERLPTEDDADEHGMVLARFASGSVMDFRWQTVASHSTPFKFIAWMPVPPL